MTITKKTIEKTKKTKKTTRRTKTIKTKRGPDNSTRGKMFRGKKKEYVNELESKHQELSEFLALNDPYLLATVTPSLFQPQPISSRSLKNDLSKNLEAFIDLYDQYIFEEDRTNLESLGDDEDKRYKWSKMIKERENRAMKNQKEQNLKDRVDCLRNLRQSHFFHFSEQSCQPAILDDFFDFDILNFDIFN